MSMGGRTGAGGGGAGAAGGGAGAAGGLCTSATRASTAILAGIAA